jgi:hypothetical protein
MELTRSLKHTSKRLFVAILCAAGLLAGCRHRQTCTAVPPPVLVDSINKIVVVNLDGKTLEPGKTNHLSVMLQYTLSSSEKGYLSLSLDQFPNTQSCIPSNDENVRAIDVPGDSGYLVPIYRGTHTIKIPVVWTEASAESTSDRTVETGTISFESSLWSDSPRYRILTRFFGTQYCDRFGHPPES